MGGAGEIRLPDNTYVFSHIRLKLGFGLIFAIHPGGTIIET